MPKQDLVIEEAPEVEQVADELIERCHPHLESANILFLFTNQERKRCDRVRLASAQRPGPLLRYLASGEEASIEEGPDFLILVDKEQWSLLREKQREALVDHELCHCGMTEDGLWTMRGHDVEEFSAVIERHGLWKIDVAQFGKAVEKARQLPMLGGAELREAGSEVESEARVSV